MRRRPDGKLHLDRVRVWVDDGRYVCERAGAQASNVLSGMASANAPRPAPDGDGVEAGAEVGCSCSEAVTPVDSGGVTIVTFAGPLVGLLPRSVVQRIRNGIAGWAKCNTWEAATVWQLRRHVWADVTLHTRGSDDPSAEVGRCAERGARANPPPGRHAGPASEPTPNLMR